MTPIENRSAWALHRAAAQIIRSAGGHYDCSQAIGFMAAAKPGEKLDADLGKPCARCLSIYRASRTKIGVAA
jgi:hypothetical protein